MTGEKFFKRHLKIKTVNLYGQEKWGYRSDPPTGDDHADSADKPTSPEGRVMASSEAAFVRFTAGARQDPPNRLSLLLDLYARVPEGPKR